MSKPIGPYSPAVQAGPFLFVSGQIGLDPATGELAGADLDTQVRQALANLLTRLAEHGYAPSHVVKSTLFLRDMAHFGAVNSLYAELFAEPYPARETVAVAGLPKDALFEISVVAYKP